jgi:hypothetical protein
VCFMDELPAPGTAHTDAGWMALLLRLRGEKYLVLYHMETQVYVVAGLQRGPQLRPDDQPRLRPRDERV